MIDVDIGGTKMDELLDTIEDIIDQSKIKKLYRYDCYCQNCDEETEQEINVSQRLDLTKALNLIKKYREANWLSVRHGTA